MCGIFGAFDEHDDARINFLGNFLKHRGPNAEGIWRNREVVIGMVRLEIRGSPKLAVPFSLAGKKIAFNGEIYRTRKVLKRKWSEAGKGVEAEIEAIVAMDRGELDVDGMFCIAIVDDNSPAIRIYRDRFGIKPCYVTRSEGDWIFSSEMGALIRAKLAPAFINIDAVCETLLFRRPISLNTIYAGIDELPPGTRVSLEKHGKMETKSISCRVTNFDVPSDEECINAIVRSALSCTAAGHSLALAVSGGVDSTLLAAIYNQENIKDMTTISVVMEGVNDGVASLKELGLPAGIWHKWRHVAEHFSPDDFVRLLRMAIYVHHQPITRTSCLLYMKMAESLGARGIRILISGEGADELFGGYDEYGHWYRGNDSTTDQGNISGYYVSPGRERLVRALMGDDAVARALAGLEEWSRFQGQSAAAGLREAERHFSLRPLLDRLDFALMTNGVEGRTPYLHGDVPEIASSRLEAEFFASGGGKAFFRSALRKRYGLDQCGARKHRFRVPLSTWLSPAGSLGPWIAGEAGRLASFAPMLGFTPSSIYTLVEAWRKSNGVGLTDILFESTSMLMLCESFSGGHQDDSFNQGPP